MDIIFAAALGSLFAVCLIALALWTATTLALEERWLWFALSLLFFPIIGPWLIWQRRPTISLLDLARLFISGAIVFGAFFFPPWVAALVFVLLLGMEIHTALSRQAGEGLYRQSTTASPQTENVAEMVSTEPRIRRAGLLEERLPVELEEFEQSASDEYDQADNPKQGADQ